MKPLEIKGARTRLGYTQQNLADVLGISVHSYRKKESGACKFTEKEKFEIARILGFSLSQLDEILFDGELSDFYSGGFYQPVMDESKAAQF